MQNFDVNKLRVASPCPMNWENMSGDERARFCQSCQLNVYNLSEMSAIEIEKLILQKEGRICGRLYKRADGTVITKDCPTGLRAMRKRMTRMTSAVFATVIGLSAVVFGQVEKEESCKIISQGKVTRFESKNEIATIQGTVTDSNGAMIPNAEVVFVNIETKQEYRTDTNDSGEFKLKNLKNGNYVAKFSANFFKDYKIEKFRIDKSENLKFEISLFPKSETVEVGIIIEDSLIDVTSSSITTVINSKMIERIPHK